METTMTTWFETTRSLGWLSLAAALVVGIMYLYQLQSLKKRTLKYQHAAANESRELRKAAYLSAIALGFFSFGWIGRAMGPNISGYAYAYVSFLSIIIAFAVGSAFWAVLQYYYPFLLEKRLNNIRFSPMKTKEGRPMHLLNEHEEDVHLTEEMLEEENAFSADYDVWVDELTNQKVIERYDTHYHSLVCEACGFRTLKDRKEEIIKEPALYEEGLLVKHFECSYCGHKQHKQVKIASWSEENEMAHIPEATQ